MQLCINYTWGALHPTGFYGGEGMENQSLPIREAADGDQQAFAQIVRRMEPLILSQVRQFRTAGIEEDDLAQEALLGLLAAVRGYQPEKGAAFTTYATACIRHRLISVARRYGKQESAEIPMEEDLDLVDTTADPALRIQEREALEGLLDRLQQRLTPMEYQVLMLRLGDTSYDTIAARLGITKKAVDNAVQRLRRKMAQ